MLQGKVTVEQWLELTASASPPSTSMGGRTKFVIRNGEVVEVPIDGNGIRLEMCVCMCVCLQRMKPCANYCSSAMCLWM